MSTTTELAPPGVDPLSEGEANHNRRWWILGVLGVAQLMVILDNTIVNIALPTAQHDLGFSNADGQWIVTAYSLAFGSLLLEGVHVRLSGEDSERGTFSQRHLVWWEAGARTSSFYIPLNNLAPGQKEIALYDSPLSEYGVLGFEYG